MPPGSFDSCSGTTVPCLLINDSCGKPCTAQGVALLFASAMLYTMWPVAPLAPFETKSRSLIAQLRTAWAAGMGPIELATFQNSASVKPSVERKYGTPACPPTTLVPG